MLHGSCHHYTLPDLGRYIAADQHFHRIAHFIFEEPHSSRKKESFFHSRSSSSIWNRWKYSNTHHRGAPIQDPGQSRPCAETFRSLSMPLSLGCRLHYLSFCAFAFVSTISPILLLRHLFPAASVPHFHLPSTSGAVAPSTSAFTLVRFFAHAFYYIRYQCELLHSKHDHSVHSITSSCAFRERHSFPASAPAVASRHESRQTKHFHHRKSLRVRLSSATSHHG